MISEIVNAAASEPSGSGTVITVLGAGGLGAIIAAVVTGLFSKRKLGAEATEIITNAAAGVVTSVQSQLDRSEQHRKDDQAAHELEMAKITHAHALSMTQMAHAHVQERKAWTQILQMHAAWDHLAIEKLLEYGVSLPPTPPLQPERKFVDDQGYPMEGVD